MAEKPAVPDIENSPGEMRGKLIKRLAVAGVLVASLLGMLAFFDYLATAPEEPDEPVYTRPVPVAPKKEITQPVTPSTDLPEPPSPAAPEPEPVVEAPSPPAVEAQPPAVVEAPPGPRPEKRPPAPSTAASGKAPGAAQPSTPTVVAPPRATPELTGAPIVEPTPTTPKPSARILESRPASAVLPPSPSRLFAGFLLQAGVFSSAQRAEELHAKLVLSGIPSTLEARVQVGPFRTRQEAEAAQVRLKELGVETVLVPPKGARR